MLNGIRRKAAKDNVPERIVKAKTYRRDWQNKKGEEHQRAEKSVVTQGKQRYRGKHYNKTCNKARPEISAPAQFYHEQSLGYKQFNNELKFVYVKSYHSLHRQHNFAI